MRRHLQTAAARWWIVVANVILAVARGLHAVSRALNVVASGCLRRAKNVLDERAQDDMMDAVFGKEK